MTLELNEIELKSAIRDFILKKFKKIVKDRQIKLSMNPNPNAVITFPELGFPDFKESQNLLHS